MALVVHNPPYAINPWKQLWKCWRQITSGTGVLSPWASGMDNTARYRIALHHTAGPQQHNASYAAQVRQTQQGHFAKAMWAITLVADGSTGRDDR